jgi:mRNA deadenylase 3'-5' endonuclease subunit Ccr4
MPPKAQKQRKEHKQSENAQASSSNGASSSKTSLLSNEMIPIPSAASSMAPATVAPFTLATWNVLADDHVYPHYYPQCNKKQLSWTDRLPLLLDRIHQLSPDILCMQEVDHWKDWDTPMKEKGYTNTYLARGGSKADGCSISFKTDRFMIVDRLEIRMDDIANLPFNDPQRIRKHCVALGLVLRPTDAPEMPEGEFDFLVVTTHLFWNPKFEDVKIRQAIYLTYQISQFWTKPNRLVICGDFNSTPDSAIATYFRTGKVDLRTWSLKSISGRGYRGGCEGYSVFGLDGQNSTTKEIEPISQVEPLDNEKLFALLKCPVLSHRLHIESAYQNRLGSSLLAASSSKPDSSSSKGKGKNNSSEIHEPITSYFKEFSGTLDYIFTSPDIQPLSILSLPSDTEIQNIGFLPTANFASDHLILMSELQIGTKRK